MHVRTLAAVGDTRSMRATIAKRDKQNICDCCPLLRAACGNRTQVFFLGRNNGETGVIILPSQFLYGVCGLARGGPERVKNHCANVWTPEPVEGINNHMQTKTVTPAITMGIKMCMQLRKIFLRDSVFLTGQCGDVLHYIGERVVPVVTSALLFAHSFGHRDRSFGLPAIPLTGSGSPQTFAQWFLTSSGPPRASPRTPLRNCGFL